jgi:hypothetical protein
MKLPRFLRRSTAEAATLPLSVFVVPGDDPEVWTWPADADRPHPHADSAPCPCGDDCDPYCDDGRRDVVRRTLPDPREAS